ncbi:unnamed protein product [Phytomonas sp. Hart1]|nr:unnamed protein product [Phytomonas sp. Hart1]|eukprot:CCW66127.1 unnamed protein product [Phytomonas sp. isolate Hart1]
MFLIVSKIHLDVRITLPLALFVQSLIGPLKNPISYKYSKSHEIEVKSYCRDSITDLKYPLSGVLMLSVMASET